MAVHSWFYERLEIDLDKRKCRWVPFAPSSNELNGLTKESDEYGIVRVTVSSEVAIQMCEREETDSEDDAPTSVHETVEDAPRTPYQQRYPRRTHGKEGK